MIFRDAVHGEWCGARTYPTRCRNCGATIYYFSCNCGSKVFFDYLGPPWPIHKCYDEYDLDNLLDDVKIKIEQDYVQRITEREERRSKRQWKPPIKSRSPAEGTKVTEIGTVREIISKVDIHKKFDLPTEGAMAGSLLGELSGKSFSQVTVYTGDLNSKEFSSYTFFIEQKIWQSFNAIRGDLVAFQLEGKSIPGRQTYWLCINIEWII